MIRRHSLNWVILKVHDLSSDHLFFECTLPSRRFLIRCLTDFDLATMVHGFVRSQVAKSQEMLEAGPCHLHWKIMRLAFSYNMLIHNNIILQLAIYYKFLLLQQKLSCCTGIGVLLN